jgi:Flp pilus assembly protein TadG
VTRLKGGTHRDESGQSLVEFALVIPVFLLILFAIFDFALLGYSRVTLINATREGVHAAALLGDNTVAIDENLDSDGGPIRANAPALVNSDLSVSVTCTPASGKTACDFTPSNGTRDAETGDTVVVSTSYVYRSFIGRFVGQSINIGTSLTTVIE